MFSPSSLIVFAIPRLWRRREQCKKTSYRASMMIAMLTMVGPFTVLAALLI